MLNFRQHLICVCTQLAQIHFAVVDAPDQRVFDRIRLLVNLFLHVVTISTFVTRVVLQIGFDLLTLHLRARLIEDRDATTRHFGDITLFQEDKATGNRQQSQLIGGDKVLAHAHADDHRATGTSSQQGARIARIHDHRTVCTAQLRDRTQHRFTQRTALRQFPVNQVRNNFGISF
ncbi:hypothetical protein D3C80_1325460 [compost metagenome]